MKAYPYLLTGALLAALSACHKNNDNAAPQPASLSTATLAPTTTAIKVASLPAPYATMAATNYPQMLMDRPAGTPLNVPAGYSVNIFQDKVDGGRWLAVAPNGDVFVAQMGKNQIMVLHDADQNGTADAMSVWAMGGDLDSPEGMAFNGNYFYVACSGAILRYDYKSGQTVASGAPTQVAKVPGGGQHFARTLLIANNKMYVGVGSSLNVVVEQDPGRATVQEFNLDGSGQTTYASGMRNPQGLDMNPARPGELWATVAERDDLGDDLVPDYATVVPRGAFFGYPWVYLAPGNRDPRITGPLPAQVASTRTPEVLFQAHTAALGLTFYNGTMFPADVRGDLFIGMRGSWNRSAGVGYKIVRIKMDPSGVPETLGPDGRGAGYEDFVTGWDTNAGQKATPQVWGRPVGLITAADGSLLIADEVGGIVWRVSYNK